MKRALKRTISIFLCAVICLLIPNVVYASEGWNIVGTVQLSTNDNISVGFSSYVFNGVPYIAYRDETNGNKLTVKKHNGVAWESLGTGITQNPVAWTSTFVSEEGTPYVAFKDYSGRVSVMRLFADQIGGAPYWHYIGGDSFSNGVVERISLYVYGKTPYVAYTEQIGYSNKVIVEKYNLLTNSWEQVGSNSCSDGNAYYPSIFVDSYGVPYVAYVEADTADNGIYVTKATVKKLENGSWKLVGARGFSEGAVEGTSLYIYQGTPYITYTDMFNQNSATVKKYNNITTIWETLGKETNPSWGVSNATIDVSNGIPYVSYCDGRQNGKATVIVYEQGVWEIVGSAGFSPVGHAYDLSMNVSNGVPYVSFYYQDSEYIHGQNMPRNIAVMRYLTSEKHSPTAQNSTINVEPGIAYNGILTAIDADGDALNYSIVNQPAKGVITINNTLGSYRYTSNQGASGTDSFTFKVNDGLYDSNIATVQINIGILQPVNGISVDIKPDTLNGKVMNTKVPIMVFIEFKNSQYDVNSINPTTVTLLVNGKTISRQIGKSTIGDYNLNNTSDLQVKFSRYEVIKALGNTTGEATTTVNWKLSNNAEFSSSDTITIHQNAKNENKKLSKDENKKLFKDEKELTKITKKHIKTVEKKAKK